MSTSDQLTTIGNAFLKLCQAKAFHEAAEKKHKEAQVEIAREASERAVEVFNLLGQHKSVAVSVDGGFLLLQTRHYPKETDMRFFSSPVLTPTTFDGSQEAVEGDF